MTAERKRLLAQVKECAERRNVTQEQIAEVTGFTQSNVARILSARYSPTLDNFLKITTALDLNVEVRKTSAKLP